jgi:hypothetical protein
LALLCFETPEQFCHRHLLARFIEERTGQVVRELDSDVHVEPHVPLQGTLFDEGFPTADRGIGAHDLHRVGTMQQIVLRTGERGDVR